MFKSLNPKASLPRQVLAPCARAININADVMALYLDHLLPGITAPGDDGNYGSAACYDVLCLQVSGARLLVLGFWSSRARWLKPLGPKP